MRIVLLNKILARLIVVFLLVFIILRHSPSMSLSIIYLSTAVIRLERWWRFLLRKGVRLSSASWYALWRSSRYQSAVMVRLADVTLEGKRQKFDAACLRSMNFRYVLAFWISRKFLNRNFYGLRFMNFRMAPMNSNPNLLWPFIILLVKHCKG